MPRCYDNLHPESLPDELDTARRAGVVPVEATSDNLSEMAAQGRRMIYAVSGDRLLVARREAMGEHISHAVLVGGGPVRAAGEFEASGSSNFRRSSAAASPMWGWSAPRGPRSETSSRRWGR